MSEWQPMSSAPRDGTPFLATDGTTYSVTWFDGWAETIWLVPWRDGGDIGWGGMTEVAPTAWMPLPAPPTD